MFIKDIIVNPFSAPWLIGIIVFWIIRMGDYKNDALFFIDLQSETEKLGLIVVLSGTFSIIYLLISKILKSNNMLIDLLTSILFYAFFIRLIGICLKKFFKAKENDNNFCSFNNNLYDKFSDGLPAIYSFWNFDNELIIYGSLANINTNKPELGDLVIGEDADIDVINELRALDEIAVKEILKSSSHFYFINPGSSMIIKKHFISELERGIISYYEKKNKENKKRTRRKVKKTN